MQLFWAKTRQILVENGELILNCIGHKHAQDQRKHSKSTVLATIHFEKRNWPQNKQAIKKEIKQATWQAMSKQTNMQLGQNVYYWKSWEPYKIVKTSEHASKHLYKQTGEQANKWTSHHENEQISKWSFVQVCIRVSGFTSTQAPQR